MNQVNKKLLIMHNTLELIWIKILTYFTLLEKVLKPHCQYLGNHAKVKKLNSENDEVYYKNFDTGQISWEHPCDSYYK